MAEPIIKLEHVNFWYDKDRPAQTQALTDINIEIEAGEYVAFFGPSGSGKTTLLYLISGVEASQDGKIMIRGRDISKFSNKELAIYRQVGVGIVFQQFNLIATLTVLNNVALPMAFLGISEKKRQEEAMKILERLAINHLAGRFPGELSGGQQQRVGIARALANNAPIIIADEPLGNLDSENSKKVLEFLKELHEKDNRTIIMVTHEAWSLRDVGKIFYIKDGQVVKTEKTTKESLAQSLTTNLSEELTTQKSGTEKMASTLSGFLLPGLTGEENKRFQTNMEERLEGKIQSEEFFQLLDKPFKDGGMGLWQPTARKISHYVEDVIVKRASMEELRKKLKENPLGDAKDEVASLQEWLLLEYHGSMDEKELSLFGKALTDRLCDVTNADDFKRILGLAKKEFGLGLAMHTVERISKKLELVLSPKD